MKNNNIIVYYDIVNSKAGDEFTVWMDVTDSAGNWIIPEAIEGDIGENIEGGRRKRVVWDLSADSIYMNALILVQVNAELIKQAEPEVVYIQQSGIASEQPYTEVKKPRVNRNLGMSKVVLLTKSVIIPGWGLTQVKQKPHWIKGLIGYGALATTIYFYNQTDSNYEDFDQAMTIADRDFHRDEYQRTDKLFVGFLYGTIGVWTVDLLWMTFTKTNRKMNAEVPKMKIQPSYEPTTNAPMLTLRYNF